MRGSGAIQIASLGAPGATCSPWAIRKTETPDAHKLHLLQVHTHWAVPFCESLAPFVCRRLLPDGWPFLAAHA